MSTSLSSTVPARAAIAGNPSDGHGGAVVATVVPALTATVSIDRDTHFAFAGSAARFGSVSEVSDWVGHGNVDGGQPLMQAALAVLHRRFGAQLTPHAFRVSTTIPRSLGLAGSSAIVLATMTSMLRAHQSEIWARELLDHPALMASLALEIERDLLGIPAGLQDRVVQAHGGTVAMEFGQRHMHVVSGLDVGWYRSVGPLPDGMFVAYRTGTAGDSGLVHGAADGTSDGFQQAMETAASAARTAADAIERADVGSLGAAMDATFDQRALVFELDPAHVEMVETARACSASANYTGSGGAVIVLAPDDRAAQALVELGCTIVPL